MLIVKKNQVKELCPFLLQLYICRLQIYMYSAQTKDREQTLKFVLYHGIMTQFYFLCMSFLSVYYFCSKKLKKKFVTNLIFFLVFIQSRDKYLDSEQPSFHFSCALIIWVTLNKVRRKRKPLNIYWASSINQELGFMLTYPHDNLLYVLISSLYKWGNSLRDK